jgi:hypothetical protein
MNRKAGFDEVMIVNPSEPGSYPNQGVRLMRFAQAPDIGYYAEPPDVYAGYGANDSYGFYAQAPEGYGYYGEPPDAYGYYSEPPEGYGYYGEEPYLSEEPVYGEPDPYGYYGGVSEMGGWGEPDPYGQYQPVGYFAEEYPMGYYGQEYPMAGYAEGYPLGYYSQEPPVGQYEPLGYYGQVPEMVGYGQEYPGVGYYGEPDMSGYVRDANPTFNPGCPLPTNVAGFGEAPTLEGYMKPATVNPTCDQFSPQPGTQPGLPDAFKALW